MLKFEGIPRYLLWKKCVLKQFTWIFFLKHCSLNRYNAYPLDCPSNKQIIITFIILLPIGVCFTILICGRRVLIITISKYRIHCSLYNYVFTILTSLWNNNNNTRILSFVCSFLNAHVLDTSCILMDVVICWVSRNKKMLIMKNFVRYYNEIKYQTRKKVWTHTVVLIML